MPELRNEFGQPIGPSLPDWQVPQTPAQRTLEGVFCRLEPLDAARHAKGLHTAYKEGDDPPSWTYLAYGPFDSATAYAAWIEQNTRADDPLYFAIIERSTGRPLGVASYLNIRPGSGSIEIGHIHYADALKQTPAATEAMALFMAHAFELGYRRYEWKCDALNGPSRRAAERLGFVFEGVFRHATVYKQRNRDTAWYAVIDSDWPRLRRAFNTWLAEGNFDSGGHQIQRLSVLTRAPQSQQETSA